jgi:hypothetical protein
LKNLSTVFANSFMGFYFPVDPAPGLRYNIPGQDPPPGRPLPRRIFLWISKERYDDEI